MNYDREVDIRLLLDQIKLSPTNNNLQEALIAICEVVQKLIMEKANEQSNK